MSTKSKVFLDLVLTHSLNPRRAKKVLLKDRRISRDEKSIIHGFLCIRDNLSLKALAQIKSVKTQSDAFVESMRLFVIGGAQNNLGNYSVALANFQESYRIYPKSIDTHLEFVILNNIFVILLNLHRLEESREIIALMHMISNLSKIDSLRLDVLKLSFYLAIEDKKLAEEIFAEISINFDQYTEYDKILIQTQFYIYGIVFDKLDVCHQSLGFLKTQKKYTRTEAYIYMKVMLLHLEKNDPIYIEESDFVENSTLLYELKFIRALDQSKISELPEIWSRLQDKNPDVFLDHYQYAGFKSVFSRCLELHQYKIQDMGIKEVKEEHLSILDAIEKKLKAEEIVSKEQLFYYLYGREIESKIDLDLISKNISRFKTSRNSEVISIRGAYKLVKKVS